MSQEPVYAGAVGVQLRIEMKGIDSLNGAVNCNGFVLVPGSDTEASWDAVPEVDSNILLITTPADEPLLEGTYKIHPYIELGTFKGRYSPVLVTVWPHWKRPVL